MFRQWTIVSSVQMIPQSLYDSVVDSMITYEAMFPRTEYWSDLKDISRLYQGR